LDPGGEVQGRLVGHHLVGNFANPANGVFLTGLPLLAAEPEGGRFDYVGPPLEGSWWIDEGAFSFAVRENWQWTLMIRQP
jgi:hypothetical protein